MKTFLLVSALVVGACVAALTHMTRMGGFRAQGPLPAPTLREQKLGEDLRRGVEVLSHRIGERSSSRAASKVEARSFLLRELRSHGVRAQEVEFMADAGQGVNLVARIEGGGLAAETVVLGAHYDTATGTPGAGDNASGCMVLVELAALLARRSFDRSIEIVFFDLGSTRHAGERSSGSGFHAAQARSRGAHIRAMLSLDSLGSFRGDPGSQSRPFPFTFSYPSQGDFVLFAGDLSARSVVAQCVQRFRAASAFPSEGLSVPGWVPGFGTSDHASFRREGFPAIVVTDTCTLRNPEAGERTDSFDRLDYQAMARVTEGLLAVVEALARRDAVAP